MQKSPKLLIISAKFSRAGVASDRDELGELTDHATINPDVLDTWRQQIPSFARFHASKSGIEKANRSLSLQDDALVLLQTGISRVKRLPATRRCDCLQDRKHASAGPEKEKEQPPQGWVQVRIRPYLILSYLICR